jgi:hypothetical protein
LIIPSRIGAALRAGGVIRSLARVHSWFRKAEQPAYQPGPLAEAPFLGGTHFHFREVGFDLIQYPRQRDGRAGGGGRSLTQVPPPALPRQYRVRPEYHCLRDFSRNPLYPAPYQMLIAVKLWTVA